MRNSTNQVIDLAINKAKKNPSFSKDLVNYCKYLILKDCPDDDLKELDAILKFGNLEDFYHFGSKVIPEFNKKITDYVSSYK